MCPNCGRKEIRVPVEEERKKEAAVVVTVEEAGEAVVRSDGFVFLHNGGAKRPQTVGLWGVFPSSARDVLPCKCFCHVFAFLSLITTSSKERESM